MNGSHMQVRSGRVRRGNPRNAHEMSPESVTSNDNTQSRTKAQETVNARSTALTEFERHQFSYMRQKVQFQTTLADRVGGVDTSSNIGWGFYDAMKLLFRWRRGRFRQQAK
jgi:hypothetical protein